MEYYSTSQDSTLSLAPILSHSKLATVDNLNKRGLNKPVQCCFCNENESINHLFFECMIAKAIWRYVCEFLKYDMGTDYISIVSKWLHKDKFYGVNIIEGYLVDKK
jgi:hypothetical protein